MTQYDVIPFLKQNKGKYYTVREIANNISKNTRSVNIALNQLERFGFVKRGSYYTGRRTIKTFAWGTKN